LIHRTLSMLHRYFGGRVPDGARVDDALAHLFVQQATRTAEAYEAVDFPRGLSEAWAIISAVNRYYDEQAPWSLIKQGETQRAGQVLYAGLEAVRVLSVLVEPIMPQVAREIARLLNLDAVPDWNATSQVGAIPVGHPLQEPKPIFPRLQPKASPTATPEPTTPQPKRQQENHITLEQFQRLKIRVATVRSAEPIPSTNKLLKLTVELGDETRTIVAGIAETYTPDQLVGRQVLVLANLQPATLRGVVSEGMLLAADVDGKAVLLTPDQSVPNGARVR
ncbi:MAG: methionine--tRNA ligase subunit beta, partial [Fimbriimonadales bacterium]